MLDVLKSKTILYVEDEIQIQKSVSLYLKNYFDAVFVADDGEAALESYRKYRPDVVLLDINLPKRDGLSVAREIRDEDGKTKIVMLTAHTEKEKLLAATELNLCRYLVKPVTPRHFKETLLLLAEKIAEEDENSGIAVLAPQCYWNEATRTLWLKGSSVELSLKERKLMSLFLEKRRQRIAYEDIMVVLWDDAFDREISVNSVKNQVSGLRKKVPVLNIESVYGIGYILN